MTTENTTEFDRLNAKTKTVARTIIDGMFNRMFGQDAAFTAEKIHHDLDDYVAELVKEIYIEGMIAGSAIFDEAVEGVVQQARDRLSSTFTELQGAWLTSDDTAAIVREEPLDV